jgi:hypothetical protein
VPVPDEFGSSCFNVAHVCLAQSDKRRIHRDVKGWLRKALHLVRATLREIFDESAYDRFLQRTHATRSVKSYRAFLREREGLTPCKPRCC